MGEGGVRLSLKEEWRHRTDIHTLCMSVRGLLVGCLTSQQPASASQGLVWKVRWITRARLWNVCLLVCMCERERESERERGERERESE